jgi:heterodisulfide reductase subunit C/cytochrome c5
MTAFGWAIAGATAIAAAGSLWRAAAWFQLGLGLPAAPPSRWARGRDLLLSLARPPRGPRARHALAALVLDVGLQRRLFRRDPVRWAAHLALAVGFAGLVFLHALGDAVAARLAGSYMSTQSPWLWLRDGFGLLVLLGFGIGIPRRRRARGRLPVPSRRDPLFIAILLGLVATGFLLSAIKIASAPSFERMLSEYASVSEDEAAALRAFWEAEYGVDFAPPHAPATAAQRAAGEAVHRAACAACHDRPQRAVASYPLSRLLRAAAPRLASWDAEGRLLWIHLALCVFGIAYAPFSRFFHIVSAPVALVIESDAPPASDPSRRTRRALALEACLRCGLCDERCSVKGLHPLYANALVLPAPKLDALRALARGKGLGVAGLAEGAYACTDCGRCTRGCPVGLRLDELWLAGIDELRRRAEPPAAEWVKARGAAEWADRLAAAPAAGSPAAMRYTSLTGDRHTFSPCVQCQTCTNVCPVVAHSDVAAGVDITPQQVMNLLRLGLVDLALGSRMVWDCATCYQCQEHCPAGIRVTEVLYELRNRGYARLGDLPRPGRAAGPGYGAS